MVGALDSGQTVWVSAAAGAVGSIAAQLAQLHGNRVIGSAGSDDKVNWLRNDLGLDAAFNYRAEDPTAALARLAPEGIDVYFDGVGGSHLEAALEGLRRGWTSRHVWISLGLHLVANRAAKPVPCSRKRHRAAWFSREQQPSPLARSAKRDRPPPQGGSDQPPGNRVRGNCVRSCRPGQLDGGVDGRQDPGEDLSASRSDSSVPHGCR